MYRSAIAPFPKQSQFSGKIQNKLRILGDRRNNNRILRNIMIVAGRVIPGNALAITAPILSKLTIT